MEKIGNIVTNGKASNYSEMFNVVDSYDNIIEGLPTLIVGWDNAKKYIPGVDILKKDYGDVFWTFSKTERRCDYEDDIIDFYNKSILKRMSATKYIYVNPLSFGYNKIKSMIVFFRGSDKKTVFFTRNSNFMFVYSKKYDTVFGVSMTMAEYLGLTKKRITGMLKNAYFIHDTSFISGDIRRVIGYNTHYILPLYEYFYN